MHNALLVFKKLFPRDMIVRLHLLIGCCGIALSFIIFQLPLSSIHHSNSEIVLPSPLEKKQKVASLTDQSSIIQPSPQTGIPTKKRFRLIAHLEKN